MPPMALQGIVTKVGCINKTATVTVSRWMEHKVTGKVIERTKKYLTHDPQNVLRANDVVIIRNCPPVSKRKRFALERVVRSPLLETEKRKALLDAEAAVAKARAMAHEQMAGSSTTTAAV
ncbi:nucleic acid-binding protein [Cylindrobasidium torrendii FP15055 ss-10]|uniref:Nucleic acid-binding protein n=1 Tax=Cylindrobasidium torrendii FP15055 ss-10 TaxID=1314674 RepID=A0A0D7B6M5_9AGAR|nr:nucleic acid-binding protein [Cylindrobasidium torrendii FP15055 ss-10]